jgi:hypothetical protein
MFAPIESTDRTSWVPNETLVGRPMLHRQIDLVGESDRESVDLKPMEIAGHDERSRPRRDFAPCGLWTVDRGLAIGSAHR